jgi:hypothetical protein
VIGKVQGSEQAEQLLQADMYSNQLKSIH